MSTACCFAKEVESLLADGNFRETEAIADYCSEIKQCYDREMILRHQSSSEECTEIYTNDSTFSTIYQTDYEQDFEYDIRDLTGHSTHFPSGSSTGTDTSMSSKHETIPKYISHETIVLPAFTSVLELESSPTLVGSTLTQDNTQHYDDITALFGDGYEQTIPKTLFDDHYSHFDSEPSPISFYTDSYVDLGARGEPDGASMPLFRQISDQVYAKGSISINE